MLLNETVPQWVIDITVDVSVLRSCLALLSFPDHEGMRTALDRAVLNLSQN